MDFLPYILFDFEFLMSWSEKLGIFEGACEWILNQFKTDLPYGVGLEFNPLPSRRSVPPPGLNIDIPVRCGKGIMTGKPECGALGGLVYDSLVERLSGTGILGMMSGELPNLFF